MGAKTDAELTVRGALRDAMQRLRATHVPSYALAAELLLMHALGCDRAWLYSHPEMPIDNGTARKFSELIERRSRGLPTQYLTRKQEFWGLEFEVTPAVLIPRPETEHVIEVAIERLREQRRSGNLQIADVGTGSGCIAVALAHEFSRAEIFATDISGAALEVARRNTLRHTVSERVHFIECDLLPAGGASAHSFDIIVSNPPYVAETQKSQLQTEVRLHEPSQALFAGESGLEIYPRLIALAAQRLRSGGLLILEIGFGALNSIRPLFDSASWTNVCVTNDLAGIPRVLSAQRV